MNIQAECRHCEFGVGGDAWYCSAYDKVFKMDKGKVKCLDIVQCPLEGVNLGELYKQQGRIFCLQKADERNITMNKTRGLWRGKRVDNGEWVEGYLSKGRNTKEKPAFLKYCIDREETGLMMSYIVDPSTLGECTGLRDKNGKLIFEGDFLKGKYNFIYTVVWDTECAGLYPFVIKEGKIYEVASKTMEVIGDIHDNPGLLNGTEESEET